MPNPDPCPGGCPHSDLEHVAFDLGLVDGRKRLAQWTCPYTDPDLVNAWVYGREVGLWEQEEKEQS